MHGMGKKKQRGGGLWKGQGRVREQGGRMVIEHEEIDHENAMSQS